MTAKKWLPNLALAGFSMFLTLLIIELAIRVAIGAGIPLPNSLQKPQLFTHYERDQTEHIYNNDYWKLNFLFSGNSDIEYPHPLLGWTGNFDHKTFEHADEFFSKDKRPVLLFGDSFSQCIDSTKCFEDYLNSDTSFTNRSYLLNFGVGGYGIDQIHLLMQQALTRFDNPIVIFGMLTTDMDRSMLRFRDAPKPYFEVDNDELILKGAPISQGSSEYIEEHPIEVKSYVFNVLRNSINWLLKTEASDESKSRIIALNKLIIETQVGELRAKSIEPIMLLFQPINQPKNDWRSSFLLNLFDSENLEVIDTRELLFRDIEKTKNSKEDYFITEDLHPTSLYNRIIAEEIKNRVEKRILSE